MEKPKHLGCFDCGRMDVPTLFSVNVKSTERQTNRGVMKPGAGGIALCPDCLKKEGVSLDG